MNMTQEQIDFFTVLNLNVDWRGAIYGKAKGNEKTVSGIKSGTCEIAEIEAKVKEN